MFSAHAGRPPYSSPEATVDHSAFRFGYDPHLASRVDPSRGGGTLLTPRSASTDPSFLIGNLRFGGLDINCRLTCYAGLAPGLSLWLDEIRGSCVDDLKNASWK